MCFSWGTASPHPVIVRDESSRVILGGALPATASASPTAFNSGAVFGWDQQGKTSQLFAKAAPGIPESVCYCRRQNRQKCGRFKPALTPDSRIKI
jgi:hypothetical protein